jgi:hypothetical protein
MSARDALRDTSSGGAGRNGSAPDGYRILFDDKGKLLLPEIPAYDDPAGLCAWLTCVFNLDSAHPITAGVREGLRGPDGHVALRRASAPPIRFEPAARINNPTRLIEALSWQKLPTDGAVHALKTDHCREISHAIVMLCGAQETASEASEAEGIVATFMQGAEAVEDHTTYGTSGQRYEAAVALRRVVDEVTGRSIGAPRYLIDTNTGELVIAVGDLQDAARRHVGSSLPRGWLDARLETLGWARISLQGYGQPGRSGRQGPHARIFAYRGLLPGGTEDQDATTKVNT